MYHIDTVQSALVAALQAYAPLANVPIVAEDGSYPKLPAYETAINLQGLVIIVWEPTGEPLHQESRQGAPVILKNYIPVVVHENVAVNRAAGGTNIKMQTAVKHVIQCLHGLSTGAGKKAVYLAADAPYETLKTEHGIKATIINYISETIIS